MKTSSKFGHSTYFSMFLVAFIVIAYSTSDMLWTYIYSMDISKSIINRAAINEFAWVGIITIDDSLILDKTLNAIILVLTAVLHVAFFICLLVAVSKQSFKQILQTYTAGFQTFSCTLLAMLCNMFIMFVINLQLIALSPMSIAMLFMCPFIFAVVATLNVKHAA